MENHSLNSQLIRYPEFTKNSMDELHDSIILFQPFNGHAAYNADEIARDVIDSFNRQKQRRIVKTLISTVHGNFTPNEPEREYFMATHTVHRRLFQHKMGIPVYYFPTISGKGLAVTTQSEFTFGLLQHVANKEQLIVVVIEQGACNREYVEVCIELEAPELVVCSTLSRGIHTACNLFHILEERKNSISIEQA